MYDPYMRAALRLAEEAERLMEIPVGAVVVLNGKIIGSGYNRREINENALAHAEIEAIHQACGALGSWRLTGCDLYVTLEPCPMCMGAIINARIKTVVFGAFDPKAGCCGSVVNLAELPFNHKPMIISGILEKECAEKLTAFFKKLRKIRQEETKLQGIPDTETEVVCAQGTEGKLADEMNCLRQQLVTEEC